MIIASMLACLAVAGPAGYALISLASAGSGLAKLKNDSDIAVNMPMMCVVSSICTISIILGTLLLLAAL